MVVIQRLFATPENLPFIENVRKTGKPLVYELDDLLIDLPPSNPNYTFAMRCRPALVESISKAAAVTVSTEELRAELLSTNPNIYVLPNLLNEDIWKRPCPRGDGRVVVGFTGTATHHEDAELIEEVCTRIAERYGNRVAFTFMGCATEKMKRLPHCSLIDFITDYESFAQALQNTPMDIALVPLQNHPFNRSKSNIKWLEYSSCGVVGIYSDLPPYNSCIQNEETGLLVDGSSQSWFRALERLINDTALRSSISLRARQRVLSEYTLNSSRLQLYEEAYQNILHRRRFSERPKNVGEQESFTTNRIRGVDLQNVVSQNPHLGAVINRVNRSLAIGKPQIASRIVQKELVHLPQSAEILHRIEELSMNL